jgi:hypothetical protein
MARMFFHQFHGEILRTAVTLGLGADERIKVLNLSSVMIGLQYLFLEP